ncbi:AGE family epimerase/isomerase [Parvularcula lutaonensis]|uniref:AGE family epimerase/isomerase n=1 Tax=Parvularcula lutaonensis TaxID=491923 RepID=A0ABV7MDU6_9PROT|nr:AGE family epimerase/isomerase [Parvularcula lutaonensis]GGY54010.1 mannose-6-phosphate isomerase [Parvularcula lutaonensis]
MNSIFDQASSRFIAWLAEDAIPRCAGPGRNPDGGYYEALDLDGSPISPAPVRLRVQARQAFSFARAEALGLMPGGREASDYAWRFMVDKGLKAHCDGFPTSFIHVFAPDGSVADDKRDTYDHAFVLLAAAERQRAYGDDEARKIESLAHQFLDALRCGHGGFAEDDRRSLPRRQNPHMHLIEAALLRRRVGEDPFSEAMLGEIRALWGKHFWDPEAEVMREFFAADWSLHPEKGDLVEPGHMAEWIWLLDEHGSASEEQLLALWDGARRHGLHQERMLLADCVDLRTGEATEGCRLWCQTEHIRAALVLARVTGAEKWIDEAGRLLTGFQDIYLTGIAKGCWHDRVDSRGKPMSDRTPASLLYHLITLADEIIEIRDR